MRAEIFNIFPSFAFVFVFVAAVAVAIAVIIVIFTSISTSIAIVIVIVYEYIVIWSIQRSKSCFASLQGSSCLALRPRVGQGQRLQ